MIKFLIPALLVTACYRSSSAADETPVLEVPTVKIEPSNRSSSTPQVVLEGEPVLSSEVPATTPVDPVLPIELPTTEGETSDNSTDPVGSNVRQVVKTLVCTGKGEPGLMYSSKIEFYDDGVRKYHFSLWNRESVIENFEAFEEPGAYMDLTPVDQATVGAPESSKVQHGFMEGYRQFLGYNDDARLYQQLFKIDDRGGMELRVGQVGDNEKPEFFGLDSALCVEI